MFEMRVKDHKFLTAFGGLSSVYAAATTWRVGSAAVGSDPIVEQLKVTASLLQAYGAGGTTSSAAAKLNSDNDLAAAASAAPMVALATAAPVSAKLTASAADSSSQSDTTQSADVGTSLTAAATRTASEPARKVLAIGDVVPVSVQLSAPAAENSSQSDAAQSADVGASLTGTAAAVSQTLRVASAPAAADTPSEPTVTYSALAAPAAAATPNKIALENAKQGNPKSEWGITGDGNGTIQGFATEISTNIGQTVDFKIATDSTHYRIDIYRMGYYGGDGARKVASIDKSLTTAQIQPHPIVDMSLGLIDAGNWSVSASWEIPTDAVSGVYFAKLVREDGVEDASIVPFVVRDDASTSDIVFQTSDTTWQAYNAWGGASLYYGEVPVDPADMIGYLPPNCSCGLTAIGRASAVSYNRPIITNTSPIGGTHDFIFGVESSAISWLEQNGYDVSYISASIRPEAAACC
jgi:hypothetical protein